VPSKSEEESEEERERERGRDGEDAKPEEVNELE
jgi:hypothetical protein